MARSTTRQLRIKKPGEYKNGGPRLRGLNKTQLESLYEKEIRNKQKAKILREIKRRYS